MDADAFIDVARALSAGCHQLGLITPAFRAEVGRHRTLRRTPGAAVVVVDRHHPPDQVIGAMIDGILAANGRPRDSVLRQALTERLENQ